MRAQAVGHDDGRVWHFRQPGDDSLDSWDPVPLSYACESITHDRRKRMTRIHLVFAYPHIPDGVGEVVEYAESLASDYGLCVECTAKGGMITVTYSRRAEKDRRQLKLPAVKWRRTVMDQVGQ